jgi:hypothetical protein
MGLWVRMPYKFCAIFVPEDTNFGRVQARGEASGKERKGKGQKWGLNAYRCSRGGFRKGKERKGAKMGSECIPVLEGRLQERKGKERGKNGV